MQLSPIQIYEPLFTNDTILDLALSNFWNLIELGKLF